MMDRVETRVAFGSIVLEGGRWHRLAGVKTLLSPLQGPVRQIQVSREESVLPCHLAEPRQVARASTIEPELREGRGSSLFSAMRLSLIVAFDQSAAAGVS